MEVIGLKEVRYKSHNGKEHIYKFKPRNYDFNKDCVGKESLRKIVIYGDTGSGKTSFLRSLHADFNSCKEINMSWETSEGVLSYTMVYPDVFEITKFKNIKINDTEIDDNSLNDFLHNLHERLKVILKNVNIFDAKSYLEHKDPLLKDVSDETLIWTHFSEISQYLYFIYKVKEESNVPFIVLDDFCNSLTDSMALYIMDILNKSDIPYIITTNKTCLMDSDILRPDCYFIMDREKGLSNICDLTDKELRESHNLEKLYRAGAFN